MFSKTTSEVIQVVFSFVVYSDTNEDKEFGIQFRTSKFRLSS